MIVIEELARIYVREKYGMELPKEFHGISYRFSKEEVKLVKNILDEKPLTIPDSNAKCNEDL
ncbi:hypothetical protein TREPR_1887 [Treponema primitia ZAS-2]|uniref:Uncharacterized protein n=1 Tax=Treponema primitia (strain ATCC BAA-887 / DSM 12427 / ZAS-2) TaxID=545694 RepID=F5YL44_TREPZ|nr:hypothetical protein [Treponema primitia]AEF85653.1 hypothetical protein TREPR_1887 [Treponema primitia ZAS-2]